MVKSWNYFDEIYDNLPDLIKEAVNEQLRLCIVSQQRELLNTFITEYNKGATDSDEIIKSISNDIIESIL